jgi:cell pole-organizing protein PopZ
MSLNTIEDEKVEEILTSIRNIIAEDIKDNKLGPKKPSTEKSRDKGALREEPVLELTNMLQQDGSVVNLKTNHALNLSHSSLKPSNADHPRRGSKPSSDAFQSIKEKHSMTFKDDLISAQTASQLSETFSNLEETSQTGGYPRSRTQPFSAQNIGQQTIESIILQMLQPMLKEWLDAHLPSLVKLLVSEQIEKITKKK